MVRRTKTALEGECLTLPEFLAEGLLGGHPWIYRNHLPKGPSLPSGSWVRFRAGACAGYALYDATSPIALRVFSLGEEPPSQSLIARRIDDAAALRRELLPPRTTAFRALFGEADGLPGITVDVYAGFGVLVTYADALEVVVPWLIQPLVEHFALRGLVRRRDTEPGRAATLELLAGEQPPEELVIEEHGHRFYADLAHGQKTGLFLDQRDNRLYLADFAVNRSVLNLFSYTGGFSVYAARAGAKRVTSVDISKGAMKRAVENFELNGLPSDAHEFVTADCYEYLKQLTAAGGYRQRFDLVICDPPSLARNRHQMHGAVRAYQKLNTLALGAVAEHGWYAAASCTSQISPEAFREILADAARVAGRRLQLIHEAGHAPDHPVLAGHKEGRYLKFVVGRVLPPH